jgi:hypothetical protein
MGDAASISSGHRVVEHMRLAVEVLTTGPGPVRTRLQAAEPHFGIVFQSEMRTRAQEHLRLRIGAGLVEGGNEDSVSDLEADASDVEVAESIALLDEERAVEIAGDMLRLYELLAGVRTDDGYGLHD